MPSRTIGASSFTTTGTIGDDSNAQGFRIDRSACLFISACRRLSNASRVWRSTTLCSTHVLFTNPRCSVKGSNLAYATLLHCRYVLGIAPAAATRPVTIFCTGEGVIQPIISQPTEFISSFPPCVLGQRQAISQDGMPERRDSDVCRAHSYVVFGLAPQYTYVREVCIPHCKRY